MSIFKPACRHDWTTAEKTFTPPKPMPNPDVLIFTDFDPSDAAKYSFGVTTVIRVCGKCGEQVVQEMLGQSVAP